MQRESGKQKDKEENQAGASDLGEAKEKLRQTEW